jgi:two-component system OmpR family sensor kinase
LGRLFWKLFVAFWLAFMAIGLAGPLAVWLLREPASGAPPLDLAALIGVALVTNLSLSSLLAWYLTRPIRILRSAFHAVAEGRLETRVQYLIGSRRDDIADLGRDFDRMAQRLQRLIGAQQRLLHDVSHELRSPLARLQAAVGLAQQEPHKFAAMLQRIESESNRLEAMLEDVLTLARLESGARHVPLETTDLIELIGAIVADAQFEARAQGRDTRFSGVGHCVVAVRAQLLQRAFENVIRNAVKYTRPGTRVEVEARCDAAQLQVTVADRGPGIHDSATQAIFEPFYRVQNSRLNAKGFGLGLAIARGAIEFHGGRIAAVNRADGGLLVTMTLPLTTPNPAAGRPA